MPLAMTRSASMVLITLMSGGPVEINHCRNLKFSAQCNRVIQVLDASNERRVRADQPVTYGNSHRIDAVVAHPAEIFPRDKRFSMLPEKCFRLRAQRRCQ